MKTPVTIKRVLKVLSNVTAKEILDFIYEHEGCIVSKVHRTLKMEQSVVSNFIVKLVDADLVRKEKHGRYVRLFIKAKGMETFSQYFADNYLKAAESN